MSPLSPTSLTQTAGAHPLTLAVKDLDQNKVTPGVLGFIVFALLGVAVWMLMKSMNKHMKKVDFEERPRRTAPATASAAPAGSASASPGAAGASTGAADTTGTAGAAGTATSAPAASAPEKADPEA